MIYVRDLLDWQDILLCQRLKDWTECLIENQQRLFKIMICVRGAAKNKREGGKGLATKKKELFLRL